MDETRKRRWDVGLGILGSLATVAAILVGVWQFNEGQRSRTELEYRLLNKKDLLDTKRQLWLERINAYRSIAEISGRLVTHIDDPAQLRPAVMDFKRAFWGTMILVEEPSVEKAMIDLRLELDDLEKGWSTPERVTKAAKALLTACRASAEKGPPVA